MATRKTKKLSDVQTITSADGNKMIPVVDSNGNVNPISLSNMGKSIVSFIPNATNLAAGLMSLEDKKYSPKWFSMPKNEARQIANFTSGYQQFVIAMFLVSGQKPFNIILSGRTENVKTTISVWHAAIGNNTDVIKIYKKDTSLFIKSNDGSDPLAGFIISNKDIGTENITIDDSYTLIL